MFRLLSCGFDEFPLGFNRSFPVILLLLDISERSQSRTVRIVPGYDPVQKSGCLCQLAHGKIIVDQKELDPEVSRMRFKRLFVYPNPFNPSTIINYELRKTSEVELSLYNLIGQKVAILVSEQRDAGSHHVTWDATGLASGVYYYKLVAGEFVQVRKMVLIR